MRMILIGGNNTVYFLARQFVENHHVTIINRDPERSKELAHKTKATVILGDGTDIARLEEAGARRADVLLALAGHDADNLIACQIAKQMYGVPRVMALVNDPQNEDVFRRLGVDEVFSITRVLTKIIEQQTVFEEITELMPLASGKINITDIRLNPGAPAVGQTLSELQLTENSLIAAIIRNDHLVVPRGNTRLEVNDHLVVITDPEGSRPDIQLLCGHDD